MNLLIFPGAGNPATPLYNQVYGVIRREAKQYGYDSVISDVRWPGHTSDAEYQSAPSLTLPGAIAIATAKIASMPEGPFAVLGRSFGCFVALRIVQDLSISTRRPTRMILWGPAPYWKVWEMFKRDLDREQKVAQTKGTKINEQFYATIEPVESLIHTVSMPTIIASGTEDKYCRPAFLNYLREIAKDSPMVRIKEPVVGAKHEVTDEAGPEVVQKYAAALFEE